MTSTPDSSMNPRFEKLVALLKELFQLDQPDLDFGLYRIMRVKSGEVTKFLEKDLFPQVKAAFAQYKSADKEALEKDLEKAIEQAQDLGVDSETSLKVKDLRARLAEEAVDLNALEAEVYDHLFNFFRRYYSEGDFIAKHVYKHGVYSIPYEGEEITLHWANKDQYYIKTSEYLRDYTFRLRPKDNKKPMRVHFRLADVAEGEHSNVKAADGKDRVFILIAPGESGHDFITENNGEVTIQFEYRPATLTDWPEDYRESKTKPPTQKDLTAMAVKRILEVTDTPLARWIEELSKPHLKSDGETADYTRLEAHLKRYTARNTFDFFIHKDLGTFMRRELDFYIKNEIMQLDDVENEIAPRVEQYLSKIKVIRKIADKIITFLAQLEDFQKKLWLKKKFVIETNYCVTLGVIPEEFYPEIAANDSQREEWVRLYAIDKIKANLTHPGYTKPLKTEFIKAHPAMIVDTQHFDADFTARMLEVIGDVDKQTDGLLIHGDNFHSLVLLRSRYSRSIECMFSDPPYNIGLGDFLYKDNFMHSSWMTMIENRYELAVRLLRTDGASWTILDNNEANNFHKVVEPIFRNDCFVDTVAWTDVLAWEKVYSPRMDATQFSTSIDFMFVFSGQPNWTPRHLIIEPNLDQFPHVDENRERYRSDPLRKWGKNSLRQNRQRLWFLIKSPDGTEVWPIKPDGTEGCWRWQKSTVEKRYDELDWLDKGNGLQPYVRQYANKSNWRPVETLWEYEDVGSTHEAAEEIKALLPRNNFQTVKPTRLIKRVVETSADEYATVLDFFAGTGTTGHAVINLNREDGGNRKFILVEMGDYFDTLLIPRIKKVTFTPEWKDGKPKRLATSKELKRGPRIIKVIRLESYEDTLNNLEIRRTGPQKALLEFPEVQGADRFREQYLLQYMLDVETRGSSSLLDVNVFTDPTAYRLKVKRPGSDETIDTNVDLLETFNYLIGLTVHHIAAPQRFTAEFKHDEEKRLRLKGELKEDPAGPWWFRTVTGTMPDGRKTLVIWRKRPGGETAEGIEQDNLVLDKWFTQQELSSKDNEFAVIYVNGDNNLENLKQPDKTWKVRLIEEDFHRLMFETDGF